MCTVLWGICCWLAHSCNSYCYTPESSPLVSKHPRYAKDIRMNYIVCGTEMLKRRVGKSVGSGWWLLFRQSFQYNPCVIERNTMAPLQHSRNVPKPPSMDGSLSVGWNGMGRTGPIYCAARLYESIHYSMVP